MKKNKYLGILPLAICAALFTSVIKECFSTTRYAVKEIATQTDNAASRQADGSLPAPLMASPVKGEIVLKRLGYTCSYNPQTRQPNYVSWALTPDRLEGDVKRSDSFTEDPDLAENQQSWLEDYRGSGYSRGHMCPAADNKWNKTAMEQSFLLSNICPQTQTLNGGDWEELESACRGWVKRDGTTLYIVCGPLFDNVKHSKIHKRVAVPERFFKAIVCLNKGEERGIAFVYSNNADNYPMSHYVCTIDQVEKLTGFNLFRSVPQPLQDKIEASSNLNDWKYKKKKKKQYRL
jgi:endonuclease G, mitochondrial